MKKTLLVLIMLVMMTGAAYAGIVGSAHDLQTGPFAVAGQVTTQICVYCHTPHLGTTNNGQYPLWNHTLSTVATYGVYSSTTMNVTPTDIGGATIGTAGVTSLCMSCHDGTVSVANVVKAPRDGSAGNLAPANVIPVASTAYVGTDLTDDHPVNFTYADSISGGDGELNPGAGLAIAQLFNGQVQCASCHDVHDNTFTPFLIGDNTNSALCLDCHAK
jgi:predicted CXXCH cytochrome family protein